MKHNVRFLCHGALIAALYVALTFLAALLGLSSGVIQLRVSEALCILPAFTGAAVPGLFIGCIAANLLTGCVLPDVIFGSLATLIGAFGAYCLRKNKWLTPLPTVVANTLIVPLVLQYAYGVPDGYLYLVATVGAGEFLSAYVLGILLYTVLDKYRIQLFK